MASITKIVLAQLLYIEIKLESYMCKDDIEQLKEFEKLMGKPNIYYEKDNLVLLVTIHKGPSNRIVDSGIESVGVQLKDCDYSSADNDLVRYMSKLLNIDEKLFNVTQGNELFKKKLAIQGSQVKPYEIIDILVEALEMTAKEEPNALQLHKQIIRQPNDNQTNSESKEDSIRVFDWRDRLQAI